MGYFHQLDSAVSTKFSWGRVVERSTATLPQSGAGTLFTITGGRILLTGIVGEVTTVIQTQLNNTKLVFDPDVTGSDIDLCAVLNITADTVGTLYTITGTVTDALVSGLAVNHMASPFILQPGGIELNCSASNTGSVKWKMWYTLLDTTAMVVAA